MKIDIDGKVYEIKVKEVYMNENKEFVEQVIPLDDWTEMVRKKGISSLFHMEEILSEFVGSPVRLSESYPHVKKPILNLSGAISRLPENLIIEPVE